jgi:hypothetical protein
MKMASMIKAGLVLIVLAIAVCAQGPWKRHDAIDSSYTVELPPGEPTRGARRLEDDNGNIIMLRSLAMTSGEMRFIVSHYDIPDGVSFSFSRTRDGIVNKLKGKIVSESSDKIAGMQSRSFKVHAKTAEGQEIAVSARLLFNGSRVYIIQAIFPRSLENTTAEGNARSVFNSFAIKK